MPAPWARARRSASSAPFTTYLPTTIESGIGTGSVSANRRDTVGADGQFRQDAVEQRLIAPEYGDVQ